MALNRISELLSLNPEIFYNPPILFHGTSKTNAETIKIAGLKTHDGYSTVTLNPNVAYALYGKREMSHGKDLDRNENEGVLLVIEPFLSIGPGTNANVFIKEPDIIDGFPAEWIKGNLGVYFSSIYKVENSKELILPSDNILGTLPVDNDMDDLFTNLRKFTIYVSETEEKKAMELILGYLERKKEFFRNKTDYKQLAIAICTNVTSSKIIEHLRRTILGVLFDKGYLLARMGSILSSVQIIEEKRIVSFKIEGKEKPSTLSLPTTAKVKKNIDKLKDIYTGIDLINDYIYACRIFFESLP